MNMVYKQKQCDCIAQTDANNTFINRHKIVPD